MLSKTPRAQTAAPAACRWLRAPRALRLSFILTRNLLAVLFLLAAALCVGGQFAVVREVLAGRAPGVSDRPTARWAEVAWVVIPAAGLIAVLVATWLRIFPAPDAGAFGFLS